MLTTSKQFLINTLILLCISLGSCKKATEEHATLLKSTQWLINAQESDGSWSVKNHKGLFRHNDGIIAVSSIALSALAQINLQSKQKDICIKKGIRFLLQTQNKIGRIGERNYANGLALYAFSILKANQYQIPEIAFRKLLDNLLARQSPIGAWDYLSQNRHRNDMSISSWVLLGLTNSPKKYHKKKQAAINKFMKMLDQDTEGAGDNNINTKANSSYTYGQAPNKTHGKVTRPKGSAIQAIIYMIRKQNGWRGSEPWLVEAKKDQILKPLKIQDIDYYRLFFFTRSFTIDNKQDQEWAQKASAYLNDQISAKGTFPLYSTTVKQGGEVMSTALGLLILDKLKP